MMTKNNMWRDSIKEMYDKALKSDVVQINWINKDRIQSGTWFTDKKFAMGGVEKDLLPSDKFICGNGWSLHIKIIH